MLSIIKSHPRLSSSAAFGVAVALLLPFLWHAPFYMHVLLGWCTGAILYLVSIAFMLKSATVATIKQHAQMRMNYRWYATGLTLLAIVVALVAVTTQLAGSKNLQGADKLTHVSLAFFTVTLAWTFMHTIFAQYYAHAYYHQVLRGKKPGLAFPETAEPGYWDFFYFSFIIATSGQTADVNFTSTSMRKTGLLHCTLSYFFNAIVLAMTINIAASFF